MHPNPQLQPATTTERPQLRPGYVTVSRLKILKLANKIELLIASNVNLDTLTSLESCQEILEEILE